MFDVSAAVRQARVRRCCAFVRGMCVCGDPGHPFVEARGVTLAQISYRLRGRLPIDCR